MVHSIGTAPILGQYPKEAFLNGDPSEVKLQSPVTNEMRAAAAFYSKHQYNIGYQVDSTNLPTIWQWSSSDEVPDYYEPHAFPCVSLTMKGIIEQLEPGVHQFFPLSVLDFKGHRLAERFLWVVCNRIAGVDRANTNLVLYKGVFWRSEYTDGSRRINIKNPTLSFSDVQTRDFHFWRDKEISRSRIFISDEAAERLSDRNLSGLHVRAERTV